VTFEVEIADGLDSEDQRAAAAAYGKLLAPRWKQGFDVTSPN
jgi:hypothetical protein